MPRNEQGELLLDATVGPAIIGFRLDAESNQVLAERAAQLGVSAHQLARVYVIEMLRAAEERAALRAAVGVLGQELLELREDLRLAVEALLVGAGKLSETEAAGWVKENLK